MYKSPAKWRFASGLMSIPVSIPHSDVSGIPGRCQRTVPLVCQCTDRGRWQPEICRRARPGWPGRRESAGRSEPPQRQGCPETPRRPPASPDSTGRRSSPRSDWMNRSSGGDPDSDLTPERQRNQHVEGVPPTLLARSQHAGHVELGALRERGTAKIRRKSPSGPLSGPICRRAAGRALVCGLLRSAGCRSASLACR